MNASEMTNEQIADAIEQAYCASSSEFGLTMREAAARLRKIDDYAEMCADAMREVAALRAKLKVAEDALAKIARFGYDHFSVDGGVLVQIAKKAIAEIRKEGSDPCNARDGEGSSLRIGWEGEKEYCVVVKYRQDLQVELEDYDYHRVTGPLPLDIAKHWLDYHKRIRTKSEDPKILVRGVSKWRVFDEDETALAAIREEVGES